MTMHVLANLQMQPLELHLPGRVVVLPPLGRCTLDETEAKGPQLRVLEAARLVRIAAEEDAAPQDDPPDHPPHDQQRAGAEEVSQS